MRRVLVSLLTLLLVAPALPARAAAPDPLPPRVAATTSDGVLAVSIRFPKVLLQPGEGTLVEASVRNVSKDPVTIVRGNSCSTGVVVHGDGPNGEAFGVPHQGHPNEACLMFVSTARLAPGEGVHATFAWDGSQATGVYRFTALALRSQQQGDLVRVSAELAVRVGDFNDMPGHWAADLVRRGGELGLANGYPDGGFHPDAPVTEAEFIKLLDATVGLQPFGSSGEHWATPWVRAAWIAGIVDDMHLSFDLPAMRLQLATWMARATGALPVPVNGGGFSDVGGLTSAQQSDIATLQSMGIVTGYQGAFNPLNEATRAEAIAMLVRLHDYLAPRPDATAQVSIDGRPVTAQVLAGTRLLSELIAAGPVAAAAGATLAPNADGSWSVTLGERQLIVLPGSALGSVTRSLTRSGIVCAPEAGCGGQQVTSVALGRPVLVLDDELYLSAGAWHALGVQLSVVHPAAPGN